jgi:DNA-binding FadR family transcriptional regulator
MARPTLLPPDGDSILQALARPVATEPAQARLQRLIVERSYQPGDRLPSESELAVALGGSRRTAREALRSLEALGLVASRAGSGWYVRPFEVPAAARAFAHSLTFHPRALLDLLRVRRAAEADVAAELAGHLSGRDLAALEDLVARMRWRAARGEQFAAEDGEFHRRILACSGNLVALTLVDLYLDVVDEMYRHGLPTPAPADRPAIAAAHGLILDALRTGDGAAAARETRDHHGQAEQRILRWMEGRGERGGGGAAAREAVQAALLWPGR